MKLKIYLDNLPEGEINIQEGVLILLDKILEELKRKNI